MKPGEIYIVDCTGSVGHEYKGKRPALVISSEKHLKRSNLVLVTPLTSKVNKKHWGDILIKKNANNHLWSDSLVKTSHVYSFDHRRLDKRVGRLDEEVFLW